MNTHFRRNEKSNTDWKIDEILPNNYNNLVPPTVNNTPVVVDVGISILNFRSIKEKSLVSFDFNSVFQIFNKYSALTFFVIGFN